MLPDESSRKLDPTRDTLLDAFLTERTPRDVPPMLARAVLGDAFALTRNSGVLALVAAVVCAGVASVGLVATAMAVAGVALLATSAWLRRRALSPLRHGELAAGRAQGVEFERVGGTDFRIVLRIRVPPAAGARPDGGESETQEVRAPVHRGWYERAAALAAAGAPVRLLRVPGSRRRAVLAELLLEPRPRRVALSGTLLLLGFLVFGGGLTAPMVTGRVVFEQALVTNGRTLTKKVDLPIALAPEMQPVVVELVGKHGHGASPLASLRLQLLDPDGNPAARVKDIGVAGNTVVQFLAVVPAIPTANTWRLQGRLPGATGFDRISVRARAGFLRPHWAILGLGFACAMVGMMGLMLGLIASASETIRIARQTTARKSAGPR